MRGAAINSSSGSWSAIAIGSSSSRLGRRCPISKRKVLVEMPVCRAFAARVTSR